MMEVKYNKELSSEIMVLHSCDNPTCINPNHLRIGTAKDNAQDREKRGRHGSTDGAGTPPKYDDSTVLKVHKIKKDNPKISAGEIAAILGTSRRWVSHILLGDRRKKVIL